MEIPYGYCQCGCGGKVSIAKQTAKRIGHIKGQPVKFIVGHQMRGANNPNWKGGISVVYPQVKCPGHPKARWGMVREHTLLAEKALGKPLPPKAEVHHHTPEQLVICQDHAYHKLLHDRQRAIAECGHANWRKCCRCHEWGPVWQYPETTYSENHIILSGKSAYHQKCNAWHSRLRWLRKKHETSL